MFGLVMVMARRVTQRIGLNSYRENRPITAGVGRSNPILSVFGRAGIRRRSAISGFTDTMTDSLISTRGGVCIRSVPPLYTRRTYSLVCMGSSEPAEVEPARTRKGLAARDGRAWVHLHSVVFRCETAMLTVVLYSYRNGWLRLNVRVYCG